MKNVFVFCLLLSLALWQACSTPTPPENSDKALTLQEYFAPEDSGIQNGGVKVIPIKTPAGTYNVWTRRFGHNPKLKVLTLHGGPGATHEYFECVQSFFPREGIEFFYYDQLGSGNSDNPQGQSEALWQLPRFVDELEQVRVALGLDSTNFILLGHSWGGILAMEYALKYQQNLKGLIISDMMSSAPEYDKYSEVLAQKLDPEVLKELRTIEANNDFENPRYMELLTPNFYNQFICRIPLDQWPEPVNRSFSKMNPEVYVSMQGPSEFGISGRLENWDVSKRLPEIKVPTLTVGATYDTMDPEYMRWMSTQVQNGQFLLCPNGSHMCMWDDQDVWMKGVMDFVLSLN